MTTELEAPHFTIKKIKAEKPKRSFKKIKRDVVYLLIIANLFIWAVATYKARSFYNEYTELLTAKAMTYTAEAKQEATEPEPIVYDKEWALDQWEKIGQRDNANLVFFKESEWEMENWYCNSKGTRASLDIGWYMWNSQHFGKRLDIHCALDAKCSTEKAIEMFKEQGWTPWIAARGLKLN